MSDFPCLQEMGIEKAQLNDIHKYSLRQEGNEDILKVYFRRKPGSMFATSRKFRFGRADKTVRVKDAPLGYKEYLEMSPFLMKTLDELQKLVDQEQDRELTKQRLLQDIDHLEKVLHNKLSELRRDLELLD